MAGVCEDSAAGRGGNLQLGEGRGDEDAKEMEDAEDAEETEETEDAKGTEDAEGAKEAKVLGMVIGAAPLFIPSVLAKATPAPGSSVSPLSL